MKLGSLKEGGRDGTLVVVSKDLKRAVRATGIARLAARSRIATGARLKRCEVLDKAAESINGELCSTRQAALAAPLRAPTVRRRQRYLRTGACARARRRCGTSTPTR